MANILVTDNGTVYPYADAQLRRDNPNVSFPKGLSEETLAQYNVFPVGFAPLPDYDPDTERLVQSPNPELVDGQWQFIYNVEPLTAEELAEKQAAKALAIRAQRDRLLQQSDWVVIRSYEQAENVPLEWTEYRQALRDIPQQTGFPSEVSWPTVPE